MDGGLGEHGVVLELRLAEGRGVGSDDDQLGLARAQSLHGRLSTQGDLTGLHHQGEPGVDLDGAHVRRTFIRKKKNCFNGRSHVVGTLLALVGGHRCAVKF